jgi:hypothetical protein
MLVIVGSYRWSYRWEANGFQKLSVSAWSWCKDGHGCSHFVYWCWVCQAIRKNKPGQKFPFDPSHDPLLLNVTLVPLNLQMNWSRDLIYAIIEAVLHIWRLCSPCCTKRSKVLFQCGWEISLFMYVGNAKVLLKPRMERSPCTYMGNINRQNWMFFFLLTYAPKNYKVGYSMIKV